MYSEAYAEPSQTSEMELFAEIDNVFALTANYFCKKFQLK